MKKHAPAAERNRGPILELLKPRLPESGTMLELASGSGQHAVYFASQLPSWTIQPSDKEPEALASIEEWRRDEKVENVSKAIALDVLADEWPVEPVDVVFCANLLHVAEWSVTEALFRGAARALKPEGKLFLYGPYLVDARPTSDSNAEFDASLRGRDPKWGLRDLGEVKQVAADEGFTLTEQLDTPANNFLLVFEHEG